MNVEIKIKELKLILDLLKYADPTLFFVSALIMDLQKKYIEEIKKDEVKIVKKENN